MSLQDTIVVMKKQQDQMESQWFIFKGEQHRGPYKTDEMVNLFALGVIGHRDLVWREGGGSWQPFADHETFRNLIFKAGELEEAEDLPPIEVPLPSIEVAAEPEPEIKIAPKPKVETALPDLPPLPAEPIVEPEVHEEVIQEASKPELKLTIDQIVQSSEDDDDYEEDEDEYEDEEAQGPNWAKLGAVSAFVVALIVSGLWFFQFRLQTYDLIGLESADVALFNGVLLEGKGDHIIRMTKDGNVIWAAVPNIIEGEAYLKLQSVDGRVLSTEKIEINSQGQFIQGLVPFKRFTFNQGQKWVPGEYRYKLAVRPKGVVTRLASMLAPYPGFRALSWVKNHSRGHSFSGDFKRFNGSAQNFDEELETFKTKMWDSLSKPLQNRLEKYQTLKQLAMKTRELWFQRLSVAITWRAFKKYDAGYGRDIAPVLQSLVIDSVRIANASREQSPLVARLFEEIEETGKQLGELASIMSASSKAVKVYKPSDKIRLEAKFEEMWQPLITKIDERISSLESEYAELKKNYSGNE